MHNTNNATTAFVPLQSRIFTKLELATLIRTQFQSRKRRTRRQCCNDNTGLQLFSSKIAAKAQTARANNSQKAPFAKKKCQENCFAKKFGVDTHDVSISDGFKFWKSVRFLVIDCCLAAFCHSSRRWPCTLMLLACCYCIICLRLWAHCC